MWRWLQTSKTHVSLIYVISVAILWGLIWRELVHTMQMQSLVTSIYHHLGIFCQNIFDLSVDFKSPVHLYYAWKMFCFFFFFFKAANHLILVKDQVPTWLVFMLICVDFADSQHTPWIFKYFFLAIIIHIPVDKFMSLCLAEWTGCCTFTKGKSILDGSRGAHLFLYQCKVSCSSAFTSNSLSCRSCRLWCRKILAMIMQLTFGAWAVLLLKCSQGNLLGVTSKGWAFHWSYAC